MVDFIKVTTIIDKTATKKMNLVSMKVTATGFPLHFESGNEFVLFSDLCTSYVSFDIETLFNFVGTRQI